MKLININATERSPLIEFDFENNNYLIKGESYPEDVSAFFGDTISEFEKHLSNLENSTVTFTFELIYFNSSSAKILMRLFDRLDECAGQGNDVTINWKYDEEDDNLMELGEEFGEDLEKATFKLVSVVS